MFMIRNALLKQGKDFPMYKQAGSESQETE